MPFQSYPVVVDDPTDLKEVRIANSANNDYLLKGVVVPFKGYNRTGKVTEYKNGERTGRLIHFEKFCVHNRKTNEIETLVYFGDQDDMIVALCEFLDTDDDVSIYVYPTTSEGRFRGCRKVKSIDLEDETLEQMEAAAVSAHAAAFGISLDRALEAIAKMRILKSSHPWKTYANKIEAYMA